MIWVPTLALALCAALPQTPVNARPDVEAPGASSAPQAPQPQGASQWQAALDIAGPVTTTDPQHVSAGLGLAHTGAFRVALAYRPTPSGRLGMIAASLGARVLKREAWDLAFDLEHTQVRPTRELFQGTDWQLDGHDRHQLSIGMLKLDWRERRVLGVISGVEVGAGRMHVWRYVSATAGGVDLNASWDPILESAAPVGIIGVRAEHKLLWGLDGRAHLRLVGAGHSPGGEIPFAHLASEWDVTRPVFQSRRVRGVLGIAGNHATSRRAVAYFQNGLGLTFRMTF